MKKKALIILPIIVIACIIILLIPKHNNNVIEETPIETAETPSMPEASEIIEEPTTSQEASTVVETTQKETEVTTTTKEPTDNSINSTHTDITLGEDEYKGDTGTDALQSEYDSLSEEEQEMVDQIVEDMMKEHPEWFVNDSTGTGDNKGDSGHVGTPSTGQYINPDYNLDEGDYSGLEGGQVY